MLRPLIFPCQLAAMPRAEVDVRGGLGILRLADDLVELDTQRVAHQVHGIDENLGRLRGHGRQLRIVDRPREPDGKLGIGRVVAADVGFLGDRYLVDAVAATGGDNGEQVDEARVDTRAEHRCPAALTRLDDA